MSGSRKPGPRLLPYQIVMGMVSGAIGGIIAVLGELRDELGFTDTEVGVIVACGFLAAFVAQIGFARLADRGHGRRMAIAGTALAALALVSMVAVDGLVAWSLSRALLGFAGGLILPGLRRAASVMDPERVGENLGRLIVAEVLGFVLGPVVSGLAAQVGGVRAPFATFAIGTALFLPFVLRLPDDEGARDEDPGRSSLDLLRIRRLQGALIIIFGYVTLIGAFEAVLPIMFRDRGASTLITGLSFMAFAVPIAVVSTRAGRAADHLGPSRVAALGMGTAALLSATLGLLPGILIPTMVLVGVGTADGFGFVAGQVMVSRSVPEARQAGAMGLMGATEVLGAGLAAIPAAVIYDRAGAELAWIAAATGAITFVLAGRLRIRGTEPVQPKRTSIGRGASPITQESQESQESR